MSVKDLVQKIKIKNELFTALIITLVAFVSFGLGRLSKLEEKRPAIKIINSASAVSSGGAVSQENNGVGKTLLPVGGNYVASKNGSKYHLPWCSGAERIKEENKIWFENKEEAEKAGYTPAGNCKGI
ncbi:hypothetical protein COV42_02680 [Candidatus Campbellbacteria bacterium CG11_big_fil_rev_8_21_14_0_20_44_21]|uniref:Ada DNA repair metal-binding domain-containing protein n=1 Tax=Candidatus Campbellbacteria bacterium CG22_combo_CG10-13_8_21_14_all_43_18 TaxID=1974530 RepID=A0A2H0DYN7_9BACT|nr:MAG: hypothetical protein COW82_00055 [Candidatus Campbellbacteria bacterium CG22_combo_CG10-13_8_21_14_all_43_18]PIR24086.1 MAG: hypothetical protein COV42_02680 [Candidatus Campbellbacteria bacterium CG11_big_fil_rev_8_21_14_0_20_44_21]